MNEFDRRDEHGDCNICLGDVLKKKEIYISVYRRFWKKIYQKSRHNNLCFNSGTRESVHTTYVQQYM